MNEWEKTGNCNICGMFIGGSQLREYNGKYLCKYHYRLERDKESADKRKKELEELRNYINALH